uniref:2,3-diaminopropionate biosynthesis protein SbnB n=1 Tax=Herbidospora sakaeratensis TaxID=564415 RepID=UPI000781F030|nr:2,3-diaminopropionate biosynthesis protein SbnB [Herbidospora sakaeratensis]
MLILRRRDVLDLLDGAEDTVCTIVENAYAAHARGATAVPHSVFLRFPDRPGDRIIGLPAYVGGERPVAALKWVSSFPGNTAAGRERASAAILLNSLADGRPEALLEGAVISARRTAASAAVAAGLLTAGAPADVRRGVTLIGCGVIGFEILRFLRARLPELEEVTLYDLDAARAAGFADRVAGLGLKTSVAADAGTAMAAHRLIALATTAGEPHLGTGDCRPGTLILHVSLRDLTPEAVLAARNVVDDTDHVCREATSLDLAARRSGNRDFVDAEIGDLLTGAATLPYSAEAVTVFSPFGLGALDAALAAHVVDGAAARGLGTHVSDFVA